MQSLSSRFVCPSASQLAPGANYTRDAAGSRGAKTGLHMVCWYNFRATHSHREMRNGNGEEPAGQIQMPASVLIVSVVPATFINQVRSRCQHHFPAALEEKN